MEKLTLIRKSFLFLWLIPALFDCSAALAEQWAKDMFDGTTHDFGTVARGAKVEHTFTIENIYEEDAEIAEVRSTCGCTTTKISKRLLKTWDKARIVTVVDTRNYRGQKDSTLTVVFKQPFPAEVRLHIHCYIRSDVVVQPGVVRFDSVSQGADAERKVTIDYAGRDDWKIERVEAQNPHLRARAVETSRTAGRVTYDLIVELMGDAPVGYLRDHLVLVTNDTNPQASHVPVPVEAVVVSSVSVRPSPLLLGVVQAGKPVTRQLVVQAAEPFKILAARCGDERFHCDLPKEPKSVQLVPVTFVSDKPSEKVCGTIYLQTDRGEGEELAVEAHVQVVP